MKRLFVATDFANNPVLLNKEQTHYLHRVLRMESGTEIIAFNGKGQLYKSRYVSLTKTAAHIELIEQLDNTTEPKLNIHLGIALLKNDAMDTSIQKACELGVRSITPIYTEYTDSRLKPEREEKKLQHFKKTVIQACEQCRLNTIPVIHPFQTLDQWSTKAESDNFLVAHPYGTPPKQLSEYHHQINITSDIYLTIGPEGGFSTEEIEQMLKHYNAKLFIMGSLILRAETAVISAMSLLQFM